MICEKLDFQPAESLPDGKNLNDTLAFQVSEENMNHNIGMPCHFTDCQPMCKLSCGVPAKNDKSSNVTANLGAAKSALFTKCNFMGVSLNLFFSCFRLQ